VLRIAAPAKSTVRALLARLVSGVAGYFLEHAAHAYRGFTGAGTTMFQTFAVTYALMKIGVEAGHPDLTMSFSNQIKRSAIKQAEKINRGWGKWEIAMFIISSARVLAKKDEPLKKSNPRAMIALDEIYEVGLKKLNERNLDHDCVVPRV